MKEIKTENGNWLAIPIPSDASNFIINNIGCLRCTVMHGTLEENGPLPSTIDKYLGDYEIVGKVSSLTNEQAKDIVETIHIEIPPHPSNDFCGDWDIGYVDYTQRGEFAGFNGDANAFRKPTESLMSLLEANGCYINNPKGDEPSPFDYGYYEEEEWADWSSERGYNDYNAAVREWTEAQENVSDEWLLLKAKNIIDKPEVIIPKMNIERVVLDKWNVMVLTDDEATSICLDGQGGAIISHPIREEAEKRFIEAMKLSNSIRKLRYFKEHNEFPTE